MAPTLTELQRDAAVLLLRLRQVRRERFGEQRQRERLQPHLAGPGQADEEEPVSAKELVLDSRHGRELVVHAPLDEADVCGMDAQRLPRREVVLRELARQLDPGVPGAFEPLQDRAEPAAEETRADLRRLERRRKLAALEAREEAAALDEIRPVGPERHLHDLSGEARREGDGAR